MRKHILMLLALLFGVTAAADDPGNTFQVKVTQTAEQLTFSVRKELQIQGRKAAIAKYLLRLDSQTPEKLVREATAEYDTFVTSFDTVSEKWTQFDRFGGQLTGEYTVTLDLEKLNQYLEVKGFKPQGGIELLVLEEPPAIGQMKLDRAFGTDVNGTKYFMTNYTTFQRRVRDAVIKKMGTFGFSIKLLEDDDLYKKFRTLDSTLTGVFFDPNNNAFTVDRDLLDTVKANNPDTIVLYYRIDALIYDEESNKVRATVAFNLKNLASGITKSAGSDMFEVVSLSRNKEMVMDNLVFCAESAMNKLLNEEGAPARLNALVASIRNTADQESGPLRLIVNASAFEAKDRKKVMYTLKKELIAQKVTSAASVKSTNTTLTVVIENPAITETDALYMEIVAPILSKLGIELSDEKVGYSGKTLSIHP